MASDGKWYPPDLHPDAPPPSGPDAPPPGWWMASDGRWYPPEKRPGTVAESSARIVSAAETEEGSPVGSALGEEYLDELFAEIRENRRSDDGVWRGTIGFTPPPSGPRLRPEPEEFFAKSNGKQAAEEGESERERSGSLLSRLRRRGGDS